MRPLAPDDDHHKEQPSATSFAAAAPAPAGAESAESAVQAGVAAPVGEARADEVAPLMAHWAESGDETPTLAPPKGKGGEKGKEDGEKGGGAKGGAKGGGAAAPVVVPQLLKDFAAKFPDAAKLIEASPKAVQMVKDAEAAGAKFGGFSEDGPGKSAWPYTIGDTVYVPKAHTDKLTAMSDFLFEINNAIRAPKFAEVHKEAHKGSKGSLTNKTYARKKVELEVEGMLQLGEVWFETKKAAGKDKDATWSAHDGEFYLAEYQAFKAGKKTKDDIVSDVLKRKYAEGAHAGKTVEQYYMEQYDAMNGTK